MKTHLDGAVEYEARDLVDKTVMLFGVNVTELGVVEAKVWPDGWGFISVSRPYDDLGKDKPIKKWIDGQFRHYILRGDIAING